MSIYKKQMGALVIGQFSSLLLSFLVPIILAHLLTNEDFGLYAQFNLISAFCLSFFSFGVSAELFYFYPKTPAGQRKIIIFQSFTLLLLLALLSFFLFLIPSVRGLLVTNEVLESNYLYLSLGIFFSIPTVLISVLYVLNHDNLTSALYLPISTLFRVALIFLFYSLNPGIQSIFLGLLTNYIILFLFALYYVFKELNKNAGPKLLDFLMLKKQVAYALPLGIANSSRAFAQQIDKLILLSYVSPSSYAIYSIASYGVPGLTQIYLSISQVYLPRMSMAFYELNMELVRDLYKSMVLKTLCYTIPVIFIIVLFAPVIVPFLFSQKYVESVPYFQLYLFTFIFSAAGNGLVLRATGETRKSLFAYLYSLIFIIPFTYFSIMYFGLNGAILSAFTSSVLPRFFLTAYDLSVLKCPLAEILPWRQIGKIVIISTLLLVPFIVASLFLKLNIISATSFIVIYLFLVFLLETHYNVFLVSKEQLFIYIKRLKIRV